MRLDFQLQVKQEQKLQMTPQLQQAIALLQLPALELGAYLEEQFMENPLLEINESEEKPVEVSETGTDNLEGEDDWELNIDWHKHFRGAGENLAARSQQSFEMTIATTTSFRDWVKEQLGLIQLQKRTARVAAYIVDNLGDDGYLHLSFEELSQLLNVSHGEVARALKVVQALDPAGIGARGIEECLLLQIDRRGDAPPFAREIIPHLDLIAQGRIPVLVETLAGDYTSIQKAVDYIRRLEPRPGTSFGEGHNPIYIQPDVTVIDIAGEWVILVNDSYANRLHLSPGYKELLANANPETKKYLQAKLKAALWLLRSIEQRRATLYRITDFILEFQQMFFIEGVKSLRPMRLQDVALALGIHESTVSRAVNGKYLQSPKGIFPYKFFFATNIETANGLGVANTSVKEIIAELVATEDKTQPLIDQEIVQKLAERGVKVSRRTVAKYRDQLGVPSSTVRKRWQ